MRIAGLDTPLSAGSGIMLALTLQLLISSAAYLAGGHFEVWMVVTAWVAGLAWTAATSGWRGAALAVVVPALCAAFSMLLFDSAYDSVFYHKQFVHDLATGWNPVTETDYTAERMWWIHHYCHFAELSGASVYMLTGIFESAAAASTIFMAAMSLILYSLLRRIYGAGRLSRKGAVAVVAVLMMNPVVTAQIFSFYNDLYVYCGVCVMAAAFALLLRQDKAENKQLRNICAGIIVALTMVLVNVKFSHTFYAAVVWAVAGLVILWRRQWRCLARFAAYGAGVFAVSLFIVGWHPYVTNVVHFGNMFFPLRGSDFDFVADNTPALLEGHGRVMKFMMAHLSRTEAWSVVRHPLSAAHWEIARGARCLGFGPLFLPVLVLSAWMLFRERRGNYWLVAGAGVSVSLSFVFDVSWVPRYSPFAWIPLGLAVLSSFVSGRMRGAATVVCVCAALAGTAGFVRNTVASACNARRITLIEDAVAASGGGCRVAVREDVALTYTFAERGLKFENVDAAQLDTAMTVKWYGRSLSSEMAPLVELPADAAARLLNLDGLDRLMFGMVGD